MFSHGGSDGASGAASTKAASTIFARFAVRMEAGRSLTVPLREESGAGDFPVPPSNEPHAKRTYAAVLAGVGATRPGGAARPMAVEVASSTTSGRRMERPAACRAQFYMCR